MEQGRNNVTPQEETRGNKEHKPRPAIPKCTLYSPGVAEPVQSTNQITLGDRCDFQRYPVFSENLPILLWGSSLVIIGKRV